MKTVPVAECKKYMAGIGWEFRHRCITGEYVFTNRNCSWAGEVAFTLRELRDAYKFGW